MKITKVETLRLPSNIDYCYVLIHTDEGITGLGETYHDSFPPEQVIHHRFGRDILLGSDPRNIEQLWSLMFRRSSFHGNQGAELRAISAIDMALWDILGKLLEVPIYRLLGGACREMVPVYYSGIYDGIETSRQAYSDWSKQCMEMGWKAGKTARFFGDFYPMDMRDHPFGHASGHLSLEDLNKGVERFEWVRDAVGDKFEIALDLHASFNVPSAIRICRAIEDLNPLFVEEPLQPHNVAALKELSRSVRVPICTGERLFSRWAFRDLLEQQVCDYIMPDLAWTGGISEVKKIAHMAETYYLPINPHNYGPLTCMALTHVMASVPNANYLELVQHEVIRWNPFLDEPIEVKNGALDLPTRSGLGRELNPACLKEAQRTVV